MLLLALVPPVARGAGESATEQEPVKESVDDYRPSLDQPEAEAPPARTDRVRSWLEDRVRVPEGSRLELRLRSYYLRRMGLDNDIREAWTYGGSVFAETGWLAERLKLGGELFTSQPIRAWSDRDGTLLLKPGQEAYTVIGQAYAHVKLTERHGLRLYRNALDLPYFNRRDNRMTPQTFELYGATGRFGDAESYPNARYQGAYIAKIKLRNADRFISMGEAGAPDAGSDSGTWMAGALINPFERVALGIVNYYTPDVLNITYVEADRRWKLPRDFALRAVLQLTDQRSVGAHLVTGSSYNTQTLTGELSGSFRGASVRAAFSSVAHEEGIRSPWGSPPTPLALMLANFDRAGEDAWLVGIAYNLSRLGLPEWSGFANFARGTGARSPASGASLLDRDELDLTLDWRPERGLFRGFWFRLRAAFLREVGGETQNDLRVIVRYDLPLL